MGALSVWFSVAIGDMEIGHPYYEPQVVLSRTPSVGDESFLVVKPAKNSYQWETRTDYQRPEGYHARVRAEHT